MPLPADLQSLLDQYGAAEQDARALLAGLPESMALWRADRESWSVAHCLDHLARTNRAYLAAMEAPIALARKAGRVRRGPAQAGPFGGLFARQMEPPVRRFRARAPRKIAPALRVSLDEAKESYFASHNLLREFVNTNADLDLTHIHFPNPFIRGVKFGVGSGLHIIAAHERRHLWQAWNIRRLAEQTTRAAAV